MKYLVVFLAAFLAGCTNQLSQTPSGSVAQVTAPPATSTNVLAEPLPGRKVRISVSATEHSLFIVNCNEHIVVSLKPAGSSQTAWGGATNACLSQSIIIPAKATLSFVITLDDGSPPLDPTVSYTALVGGVHASPDIRSPQVPPDRMTSNSFKLLL